MTPVRLRGPFERYLPLGYFTMAVVLVVALLPSALRPPPDQASTSAEFSPDAPPDEQVESIVAALNRGVTGTAGSGQGQGGGEGASAELPQGVPPEAPPPTMPRRPRACRSGVGNPPRQTDSLYSAPCAEAWSGDNGGATTKGVSEGDIRVTMFTHLANSQTSYEGEVYPDPQPNETAQDRTFRVLRDYINANFQFYGRQLRLFTQTPGNDFEEQRAAAGQADSLYKVFAANVWHQEACGEFARRNIVHMCGQQPLSFYQQRQPYSWGWFMQTTQLMRFASEYICKKLVGKPAAFAGDEYKDDERRFGMIALENTKEQRQNAADLARFLREECGVDLYHVSYSTQEEDAGQAQVDYSTAISRMKVEGVTTIMVMFDFITGQGVMAQADAQAYQPEWFVPGYWANDQSTVGRLYPPTQWSHAFGFSGFEMERPNHETDCWRAYRSMDPDNNPNGAVCQYFYPLMQLANGIQLAGPDLTPESFAQALHTQGYRFYDDPVWAIGGGFAPDDPTYMDNVVEIWWDATARDPDGNQGAYRYVRAGKRYRLGEFQREDPLVFSDG